MKLLKKPWGEYHGFIYPNNKDITSLCRISHLIQCISGGHAQINPFILILLSCLKLQMELLLILMSNVSGMHKQIPIENVKGYIFQRPPKFDTARV